MCKPSSLKGRRGSAHHFGRRGKGLNNQICCISKHPTFEGVLHQLTCSVSKDGVHPPSSWLWWTFKHDMSHEDLWLIQVQHQGQGSLSTSGLFESAAKRRSLLQWTTSHRKWGEVWLIEQLCQESVGYSSGLWILPWLLAWVRMLKRNCKFLFYFSFFHAGYLNNPCNHDFFFLIDL